MIRQYISYIISMFLASGFILVETFINYEIVSYNWQIRIIKIHSVDVNLLTYIMDCPSSWAQDRSDQNSTPYPVSLHPYSWTSELSLCIHLRLSLLTGLFTLRLLYSCLFKGYIILLHLCIVSHRPQPMRFQGINYIKAIIIFLNNEIASQ